MIKYHRDRVEMNLELFCARRTICKGLSPSIHGVLFTMQRFLQPYQQQLIRVAARVLPNESADCRRDWEVKLSLNAWRVGKPILVKIDRTGSKVTTGKVIHPWG